jgi:opacity protein-like surface antigen
MRNLITVSALAMTCAMPVAASAQDGKNDVHGFVGVTAGTATFGTAVSPAFGGRVGLGITRHIQIVGEAGRLAGFKSAPFDLLGLITATVRVSAFYGEGGVRFIAVPRPAVRPYAEVTAGVTRLNASLSGPDGGTDPIIDTASLRINSTRPTFGAGGGLLLDAGPLSIDIGYRYKRISPGDTIVAALNDGKDYLVNQVRVGIGVRF